MPGVILSYEVPLNQVRAEMEAQEDRIAAGLLATVKDTLDVIGQAQILSYTQTGNPSLRRGQKYQRTLDLQRASETQITSTTLPEIAGVWRVNEAKAPYGLYVLGRPSEQARIHRGRWKSLAQVEKEAKDKAPGILERNMK